MSLFNVQSLLCWTLSRYGCDRSSTRVVIKRLPDLRVCSLRSWTHAGHAIADGGWSIDKPIFLVVDQLWYLSGYRRLYLPFGLSFGSLPTVLNLAVLWPTASSKIPGARRIVIAQPSSHRETQQLTVACQANTTFGKPTHFLAWLQIFHSIAIARACGNLHPAPSPAPPLPMERPGDRAGGEKGKAPLIVVTHII